MNDYATMPVRSTSESRMANEGQQNAGGQRKLDDNGKPYYDPAPLSQYPRMLYKRTDQERTQEWADAIGELKEKPMVINRYEGYLCDTCIANSATEAEALAEMGWDTSPKAAYGVVEGIVAATSAKDEEIAALRAQLAAMSENLSSLPEAPRRGRPPKNIDEN